MLLATVWLASMCCLAEVEIGPMMGFELDSETGSRFTSRRHSPVAEAPLRYGKNTFLVIGTDPPSSRSGHIPATAPGKLESLPVGQLIPITVVTSNSAIENSVATPDIVPCRKPRLLSRRMTSHAASHSAPVNTTRTVSWRKTNQSQASVDVQVDHLKPAEPDLRQEQLVLSSSESMADAKCHSRQVLRLWNTGRVTSLNILFQMSKLMLLCDLVKA